MKYVDKPRRRALEYEKALVEWWKKNKVFEKSIEQKPEDNSYVFYDGPPFITGNPHHGTLLSSILKDVVPRFWTMRGKRVERRWGWDCHGLPAENFVEQQLGIKDRREIGTKVSLETYIKKARESMVANSETWEGTIDRVGRWVNFKGAYRTMDKDFMESVWWAFKTLYEKGKIFEGRKVLMYDTKFATPVSKAEVTMDNDAYKTVTDPSAFVLFSVSPASADALYFLAWTTTPWTLPANLALAVNPKMEYGIYEIDGKKIIVATKLAKNAFFGDKDGAKNAGKGHLEPLETFSGKKLVGMTYEPLMRLEGAEKGSYRVYAADFVSEEDGTGIVHIAPAYGEDDYQLSLENPEIGFVDTLDENGYYLPEVETKLHELGVRDTDDDGIEIWAANKFIAKVLEEKGIVREIRYIKHDYPFNPRSKQRVIYRAFPSWFFDVTSSKEMLLEKNEDINWFPGHIKHGRFAKNIEAAPDWNLSRDRFWATAMPVWKSEKGTIKVVGSYDELYELSGVRLEDYHRPWVDEIEFDIDGEHFKRVDKVLDCWFESGSMPFAQLHYPFENKEKFEKNYPADFIVEYIGQVRAWFYYVHVVNTALFGEAAYKNVIVTGTLAGNDGRKMSKSLGNYTDPNELMDKFSADSLRFLLLSSPVVAGEDFALIDKDVSDTARKLTMVWNVYDFFKTYAAVDDITSEVLEVLLSRAVGVSTPVFTGVETLPAGLASPASPEKVNTSSTSEAAPSAGAVGSEGVSTSSAVGVTPLAFANVLDRWIVSRVHQLRDEITEGMEEYNLPKATGGILPFIDDLSNWFVRRSRRRFWKSEDDSDKMEAYATLYYALVYLSKIIAPFVPFLAEELYQNMTGSGESVHLLDWPEAGEVDEEVVEKMTRTREIISEGLKLRMQKSETEEQVKVRQPLSLFTYAGDKLENVYEQMIKDEVNVKKVVQGKETKLDKTLTPELKAEGFTRELIRVVQAARKKARLSVDDRIKLYVSYELEPEWEEMLKKEVLAEEFSSKEGNYEYDEIAKVNGEQVTVSLEKA